MSSIFLLRKRSYFVILKNKTLSSFGKGTTEFYDTFWVEKLIFFALQELKIIFLVHTYEKYFKF